MNKKRIYSNVAVFAFGFLVMITWALSQVISFDQVDQPYKMKAQFANAFGLLPNAEVTYLGVDIGSISEVTRIPGGVEVTLKIKKGKKVPKDSTANILRKSAIGEPYVDFVPPDGYKGDAGPFYAKGDVIPVTKTTVPLEFSELLRSASALVASIPPESIGDLLHELAIGLKDNSDSLRQLSDAGDRLSATFAERTATLDRLATNSTKITKVLADHRGSLGQSLTDLHALAESLNAAKGDTSILLDRGTQLLGQVGDIVAHQKGDLDCDLKTLELVLDTTTTDDQLRMLRVLLDVGPKAFAGLWDSIDHEADGAWIRVGLVTNGSQNLPKQYEPPKTLPSVKPVAPCSSGLKAVGADYALTGAGASSGVGTGSTATGTSTSPIPATGWEGPLSLAGSLLAMAAIARMLLRRSRVEAG